MKRNLTLNRVNISGNTTVNCTVGYIDTDVARLYTLEKRFNYDNIRKYGIQGNSSVPDGEYSLSIIDNIIYLHNESFLTIYPTGDKINRHSYFFNKNSDSNFLGNGISVGDYIKIENSRTILTHCESGYNRLKDYIVKNSINKIEIKTV